MQIWRSLLLGGWMPERIGADAAFTAVRVCTGLAMALGHGWGKVSGPAEQVVNRAANLGFPLPELFGWGAALSEFAGGLLLAAGLLTRPAAFFILCTMTVAIFSHWHVRGDPFTGPDGSYERASLFWLICLQFIVLGSGRLGLDRVLRR